MKARKTLAILSAGALAMMNFTLMIPAGITVCAEETAVNTGKWGSNLTWTLDADGLLTISGQGDMEYGAWLPWIADCEDDTEYIIKEVVIKDGVTSICSDAFAFEASNQITRVSIPDSVTKIGKRAFYGCKYLTFLTIPDTVTSIGSGAFMDCSSLTEIKIPDGIISLEDSTFSDCIKLTGISLPDSLATIGYDAFSGCSSLDTITIPSSVSSFGSGVFEETPWLAKKRQENPVVVVNNIVVDARTCKGDVSIPDGVIGIVEAAFVNNKELTGITMPDSVIKVGGRAFEGCKNLRKANLSENLEVLGFYLFYKCSSLESITIPEHVTEIQHCVFRSCTALTEIVIPATVSRIHGTAFDGTAWLTAKQQENPFVIVNAILVNGKTCTGNVTIPYGVSEIGEYAFESTNGLTGIEIPETVTEIREYAFWHCTNLKEVIIPDSVKSIGKKAFWECGNLTDVVLSAGMTEIQESTFNKCYELTNVVIPAGITRIGKDAFSECNLIKNITIPETVTEIEGNPFYPNKFNFLTISGSKGSFAESFAAVNGFPFTVLEKEAETTVPGTTVDVSRPTTADLYGDTNLDGLADISDVVLACRYIGNDETAEIKDAGIVSADVDGDGQITANDTTLMLKKIAKKIMQFPAEEKKA